MPRKRGFTLIELIVVIVVISILAAMSFTLIPNIFKFTTLTMCRSRLRQIGIAFNQYARAHNGWTPSNAAPQGDSPHRYQWINELSFVFERAPAMKKFDSAEYPSLTAPIDKDGEFILPSEVFFDPELGESGQGLYAMSKYQLNPSTQAGVDENDDPHNFIGGKRHRIQEFVYPGRTPIFGPTWRTDVSVADSADNKCELEYRHSGRLNVLFLEGHIETFTANSTRELDGKTRDYSPDLHRIWTELRRMIRED